MKFIEFTITTTSEASELVSDILWDYTSYGVAICDSNDIIDLIQDKSHVYWDYINEKIERQSKDVLVKAFVLKENADDVGVQITQRLEELKENAKGIIEVGTLEMVKREVEGDDWIEIWRKHFRPMQLGRVWVCPEWIEHQPGEGEVQIRLDSNMAFGTGEHETTSMCIKLLQKYIRPPETVIDVGCGSGILGISAVLLGAKRAILTDIDMVAVRSAEHNCALNNVTDKTIVAHANLLDNTDVKGDLIVANITADILISLSKSIPKNLTENGILILSGIIHSRYDDVLRTYLGLGLKLKEKVVDGEWIAVTFGRA